MSNPNHVERVTLTVELGNGDMHKMVVHAPGPQGSNPRFMGQQLASALDDLARRAHETLETHASQIQAEAGVAVGRFGAALRAADPEAAAHDDAVRGLGL